MSIVKKLLDEAAAMIAAEQLKQQKEEAERARTEAFVVKQFVEVGVKRFFEEQAADLISNGFAALPDDCDDARCSASLMFVATQYQPFTDSNPPENAYFFKIRVTHRTVHWECSKASRTHEQLSKGFPIDELRRTRLLDIFEEGLRFAFDREK